MDSGATCEWKYPMNPSPSRGMPMHLSHNFNRERFSYGSQENAVLRSVKDLKGTYISFEGHSKKVTMVQCSTQVDKVVSGDELGYVNIWNADHPTLMVSWDLQGILGAVHDASFTDEGDKVAFVGEFAGGKSGRAVNINMKKTDQELSGHAARALSCTYKPSRPYKLYTGSEDNSINVYSASGYNMTKSIKTHKGFVNCVRASPDSKWFVSCSADKSIIISSVETDEIVKHIENAHGGSVYSATWFEDSSKFATCSADKTVKIWSCQGDLLSTLAVAAAPVIEDMQMGIIKVKGHLISVSLSGNLNVWKEESLSKEKVDHPD